MFNIKYKLQYGLATLNCTEKIRYNKDFTIYNAMDSYAYEYASTRGIQCEMIEYGSVAEIEQNTDTAWIHNRFEAKAASQ